jgi:Kdo2-lipid IVA lauroyltransferase/acyltransferase
VTARRPGVAHRLEYLLFSGALAVGNRLGNARAERFGGAVASIAHRPLGIRRRDVEAHLRLAFPEAGAAWIGRTAAAAYRHLGREAVSMLRLSALTPEAVIERTRIEGLEAFAAALAAGAGVVVVTGHLGNWEIGGAALAARGVPLAVVAQRQGNPLFDRAIVAARERLGMQVIERGRAPRLALRALREGRAVAFVADQNARGADLFVPFFGRLASTHRGPALLALRTGAPVFLGTALREGGGYRVRLEAVDPPRDGEPDQVVERITAAFTARLEEAVRSAPEQYFWHHRRWKTRPAAAEPPPSGEVSDRATEP